MTIGEYLKSLTHYPVSDTTIEAICLNRGVGVTSEAISAVFREKPLRLSVADLYIWLSNAPNVNQSDVSFSFTADDKLRFRNMANIIYNEFGETSPTDDVVYGYKGSRL